MDGKLKSSIEIFNSRAQEYQDKFMDTALYHDSFDIFCETMSPDAEILDIGCGPGNIAKYLLFKNPEFRILGIDFAPNMIELAQANNPTADFKVMDCREIDKIDKSFDGIICGFCFPYLTFKEVQKLIRDCAQLLKIDGTLYISTMEEDAANQSGIKKNSSGEQTYIHFYREDDLVNALEINNFIVADIQRLTYLHNDSEVTDIIIIAKYKSGLSKIINQTSETKN